jgi:hypothetical protein
MPSDSFHGFGYHNLVVTRDLMRIAVTWRETFGQNEPDSQPVAALSLLPAPSGTSFCTLLMLCQVWSGMNQVRASWVLRKSF